MNSFVALIAQILTAFMIILLISFCFNIVECMRRLLMRPESDCGWQMQFLVDPVA